MLRILCLLLLLCSTAAADDREDRETARREFAAGQAADRRKAYEEAIEHYMRANDLVPHPFAMYNIAVDFERLGRLREAATWYERYLDNSSTKEADRERVNRHLITLRNKPARVEVLSKPDGARVIVNGVPVGATPYRTELDGGFYNVTVQKGNERDSKEVTIEYGEPVKLEFAFSAAVQTVPATTNAAGPSAADIRKPRPVQGAAGVLLVRGEPFGAIVSVDGMPIGTVPMSVALAPGQHVVRVTANGYAPYEQPVQITAHDRTPIEVRLPRALDNLAPAPAAQQLRVGYLLGGGGGADARGSGALYMGELGFRASQYDLAVRVGRLGEDVVIVDLLARWALTKSRVAPFIGGGYSYVSGGYGYVLAGGVRIDLVDNDKGGVSVMAESGYRFYSGTSTSTTTSEESFEGSIVPVMASLLVRYR